MCCWPAAFAARSILIRGAGITTLSSAGGSGFFDIFILKLDPAGNFLWARRLGGPGDDQPMAVAVGPAGYIYTTGSFSLTADFDPGAGTYAFTSSGCANMFLSQLDPSGIIPGPLLERTLI